MLSSEHGSRRGPRASAARILVLDDEPMIRHIVGRTLEGAGYEVVVLIPPFGATEMLADVHFDLVITNSIMPAESGAQLVARIRREFPQIPVLHLDDQSHELPPEFPADVPRLEKPFSNGTLLREVAQRLGPSRHPDERATSQQRYAL
ncbi:MAG TPA: response regulator [Gemmatimonadales bacterium]|nr:response regulator [Gemmatimonadales bacterium]